MSDVSPDWAYLSRVAEAPCAELAAMVSVFGVQETAERVRRLAVPDRVRTIVQSRHDIDSSRQDLETLARLGGRLVTPDDPEWPGWQFQDFATLDTKRMPNGLAPLALWVLGEHSLSEVTSRAAALVGTRACTGYGEHVAAELASGLAANEMAVVSGGAFGIDGAAHRAALTCEGITVAVLAGGVDVPYPSAHSGLLYRIARHGLVVSEYPPGVRPARYRFLTRNRLVAALSGATVVVEAGVRSGAANTAAWARGLGKPVGAVPGPITSVASAGTHIEIAERGARLVVCAQDVIELAGRLGEFAADPERPVSIFDGLGEDEKRVYDALPGRGSASIQQLIAESGLTSGQVQGALAILELEELVVDADGGWKIRRRGRAR
ncbi:DNA-processing protein DprA [Mycobacteroides chelonae]|uniref:DNA protecting protein DprA n=1 Tax=Mycobacteroides chelonae TaxID=1774 RepID=A0AB73LQZ0_MYCCH|nr:DNA-processing protein DprA [Mycobacteroides chelonae]OHT47819.1 DNA protecting protein DprA [Mycobacteroides chelonae]OHT62454.1 DNA protecting protein DprA [Mycobacteroides chelonae]OHT66725.1 DNA protecting protein DprA [Mycobacteroides chelonae]OHU73142.1 DNA protecting protein DprA [Mycobacteroides chelonae]